MPTATLTGEPVPLRRRGVAGGRAGGWKSPAGRSHEDGVVTVPDHLSDEEAATLPCAAVTAWHGLVAEGQVRAGDSVLAQGTGGVSLFALQFARLSGARVIITSSRDDKLKRALGMGA